MTYTHAILLISADSLPIARRICQTMGEATIFTRHALEGTEQIASYSTFVRTHFHEVRSLIFIGAMGICVRSIAGVVEDKHNDPPVLCVDSTGYYVIPVLSGHVGGANRLAQQIARAVGGEAVITTQSDRESLWALDTLGTDFGWNTECSCHEMNQLIAAFVRREPTALLLDVRDRGTEYLERSCPDFVDIFYRREDLKPEHYHLILTVTPFIYTFNVSTISYRPKVLHLGVGCRKKCLPQRVSSYIRMQMENAGLSPLSLSDVSTIELKKDEPLLPVLQNELEIPNCFVYTAEELSGIEVPNPSERAFAVTGVYGVAEGAALRSAKRGRLLLEKQKGCLFPQQQFTFAVALDGEAQREGHVEIVGAGPGDPELVSVRGKYFLERADLILYAGSLVPKELTDYAKNGATVRSSADLTLEEQFHLMKRFYDRGLLVVRLHTGDPCIYGAIQEQMAFFDRYGMRYHITPGISSFQAAAAALRSQFTIPERVQTIILTRGEGRTPMPEKEQLEKLAQSQSTMCIYLSAAIVEDVQQRLLQAYPPETPVAACYKLTWKEEKIYRGQLKDLARIVRDNNLSLTTLLVVGEAIDNRSGLSRLYAEDFQHLFRS